MLCEWCRGAMPFIQKAGCHIIYWFETVSDHSKTTNCISPESDGNTEKDETRTFLVTHDSDRLSRYSSC